MFAIDLAGPTGLRTLTYDPHRSSLTDETGAAVDLSAVGQSYRAVARPVAAAVSCEAPGRKGRSPRLVNIQLGLKCNYSCSYCLQLFQPAHDEGRPADVVRWLDSMAEWCDAGTDSEIEFRYWGGEPFLYWKKLRPLAEALKARYPRSKHSLVTNGTLLDAGKNEWLERLGFSVAISHDGPGQAQRGADPFEDAGKAAAILDLYDRLAPHGRVSFNVVLTAKHHDLDAIHAWFSQRLAGRPVSLNIEGIVLPYHDGAPEAHLREDQRDVMMTLVRSLIAGRGREFHSARRKLEDFYGSIATARPAAALGQKCGMDRQDQISVTLKGDVLTCHNVSPNATAPNGRSHRIGSLSDLASVSLDTATHWSLRDECSRCPVLQLCKGSCMYLQGAEFKQACANEFAYNMAHFMAGLSALTGMVPVSVRPLEVA